MIPYLEKITPIIEFLKTNYWFSLLLLMIFLMIVFNIVWKLMFRQRVRYALKFGKLEHWSGRVLGLFLVITLIVELSGIGYTVYLLVLDFVTWFIYLVSHSAEKRLYPSNFR